MRRRDLIALIAAAAITWPVGARAQQPMPIIGYLSVGSPETDNIPGRLIAFQRGLHEMGYDEGQNVTIEYRWAEGQYDRLPALAIDLINRRAVAIVTPGAPTVLAARLCPRPSRLCSIWASALFRLASSPASTGWAATLLA